ncbi:MAG TPA: VacJ family lipoprotein [Desulfotignum sp.]|nr:VacJ family lipoprotein [Desulfotignum sp.]
MKNIYRSVCLLGLCVLIATGSTAWAQDASGKEHKTLHHPAAETETVSDDALDYDLFDEFENGTRTDQVSDPLYPFNYAMYVFNDRLYFYVLKPVAKGYEAVMPIPARRGIRNFFHNLMFPVRFVNNLLQGKLEQASDEFGIFLVNSTAGILGFNQVAQKYLDMHTSQEDLGQTLGTYRIREGFYLVLPVLGPSTLRDALGRAGDSFITPVNYVEPWELEWGLRVLDVVNRTSFHIGDYEAMKKAALDPYAAIRDAYIQNRQMQIKN